MAHRVEVSVRTDDHGHILITEQGGPERDTRDRDGQQAEAFDHLDQVVDQARTVAGLPTNRYGAYGWMRRTLHGVAKTLGITAPHVPSDNERDAAWGEELVKRVRAVAADAPDTQTALLLTPEELAELLWDSWCAGERLPADWTTDWSTLEEKYRAPLVRQVRLLQEKLAEREDGTPTGNALAYVRAATESQVAQLRTLADEIVRQAESTPSGAARQAYEDAAMRVRGAFLDRTVDMAKAGEPLVHPEFRTLVTELASVLGVPHSPMEPLVTTLASVLEKARGLESMHLDVLAKLRERNVELDRLRQRNTDCQRVLDAAWGLIANAGDGAGDWTRMPADWVTAAEKWSDTIHGADTRPDNRWLVDRYLAEHDMVLMPRGQVADEGLSILRGGSMTATTPGDPLGLGGKVKLSAWEFRSGDGDAHFFTVDPKSPDEELSAAMRGGKSAWAELVTEAAKDGRLRIAADPSDEGVNPVFLRVGDGPGMPVILDSAQPHGSFSLRAPRARGDITPGGPLDLGDATTVAEVSRALSRFDNLFHVAQGEELRSLPDRINELVDENARVRALPAQRIKELANALGLSREQRNELFRGKDDEGRWGALVAQMVSLLHELNRMIASVHATGDESVRPGGLGDVDGWGCLADAVDRMATRLVTLEGATADELGDPARDVLARWLDFAVDQAEAKTGVPVADARGSADWMPLLGEVAEQVLLCAAGVRQAEAGGVPVGEAAWLGMELSRLSAERGARLVLMGYDDYGPVFSDPDLPFLEAVTRTLSTRVASCPSVSRGAKVPCGGRHRHESADGSLVWNDDEEPYTPQAVADLEHELGLRAEALIRALKLTEDERSAMRADAGDNVFRQYALTLAASARKAMSTYGLTGGMSDDLTAHLALPSIELQELRERLEQAAPVDRWRTVLDVVQRRCDAFASIKSLVQPWNGAMSQPADVVAAVRRLAEEKHTAQLDGSLPVDVLATWLDEALRAERPDAWWIDADGPDDFRRMCAGMAATVLERARVAEAGAPIRDRIIGHVTYLGAMAGMSSERAHKLGFDAADRVLSGSTVDQEQLHAALAPDLGDEVTRQTLIGDRAWFEAGSPEPGPQVLAVRQVRDLDPDDGGSVVDALYVRNGSGHWLEIRDGQRMPTVWHWPTVNTVAVADCSGEVAHRALPEGDGWRVVHTTLDDRGSWFEDKADAERDAAEHNRAARPSILDRQ